MRSTQKQIMDFIDWCHHVLHTLEQQRFHPFLSDYELQNILSGAAAKQSEFHFSNARHGMFDALDALSDAGLAEGGAHHKWKITSFGRQVLSNPTDYWTAICQQEIDPEEAAILTLVNRLSPQQVADPEFVWLEEVGRDPILTEFNIDPPELRKSNEHMAQVRRYVFDLPELLADRNFLKIRGVMGGYNTFI